MQGRGLGVMICQSLSRHDLTLRRTRARLRLFVRRDGELSRTLDVGTLGVQNKTAPP